MIFVYYNNLHHFTIANRTPLKPRVKPFFLFQPCHEIKMQMERCPHLASAISGLPLASKREKKMTKQQSPSSFHERRTGMLQIETLTSTEALEKTEISKKNMHTPETRRDYHGYDDSECSNKCRCAFCQKTPPRYAP
jgi:hypothetical protein